MLSCARSEKVVRPRPTKIDTTMLANDITTSRVVSGCGITWPSGPISGVGIKRPGMALMIIASSKPPMRNPRPLFERLPTVTNAVADRQCAHGAPSPQFRNELSQYADDQIGAAPRTGGDANAAATLHGRPNAGECLGEMGVDDGGVEMLASPGRGLSRGKIRRRRAPAPLALSRPSAHRLTLKNTAKASMLPSHPPGDKFRHVLARGFPGTSYYRPESPGGLHCFLHAIFLQRRRHHC